jgi:hypothetical protein
MKRSLQLAKLNLRVGIFAAVTCVLVLLAIFFPIRGLSPFNSKMPLVGYFQNSGGLNRNSPVYLLGIEVGKVSQVGFTEPGSAYPIKVVVQVERKVAHLLRSDSQMSIVSKGLLGDMFVELSPGDPALAQVAEGQTLQTQEPTDMMAQFGPLKDKLEGVLDQAQSLLVRAQSSSSSVGSLFTERVLYEQLVAMVKEIQGAAANLNTISRDIDAKILDKNTKQGIDSTVASARRIAESMDKYTEKIDAIRWYMDFAGNKYEGNQYETTAHLRIVPNPDRYYMFGLSYFNTTSTAGAGAGAGDIPPYTGTTTLTYDAALGFRVLNSPLFFWGGAKRSYFATGLDLRLFDESLGASADVYQFGRDTAQLDLAGRWRFFNVFSITGGADDVLLTPHYHAGLMFTYDDQDLTTILIKIKTGL